MRHFVVARFGRVIGKDGAVADELPGVRVVAPVAAIGEDTFAADGRVVPEGLVDPVPDGTAHDDIRTLNCRLIVCEVAEGVHHVVGVFGDVEGLVGLQMGGFLLCPAHGGILIGAHIHNVVVALIVGGAGEVARLDGAFGHGEIAPGPGFVSERPNHNAGLVLVALHHGHDAVNVGIHPFHWVGKGFFTIIVAVRFNVGLVFHIDAIAVAQVVEIGVGRVVRAAHVVDVGLLHQADFFFAPDLWDGVPQVGIGFMAVDTFELDLLTIDPKAFLLVAIAGGDFHLAEAELCRDGFDEGTGFIAQFQHEGIEIGRFCRPECRRVKAHQKACFP